MYSLINHHGKSPIFLNCINSFINSMYICGKKEVWVKKVNVTCLNDTAKYRNTMQIIPHMQKRKDIYTYFTSIKQFQNV